MGGRRLQELKVMLTYCIPLKCSHFSSKKEDLIFTQSNSKHVTGYVKAVACLFIIAQKPLQGCGWGASQGHLLLLQSSLSHPSIFIFIFKPENFQLHSIISLSWMVAKIRVFLCKWYFYGFLKWYAIYSASSRPGRWRWWNWGEGNLIQPCSFLDFIIPLLHTLNHLLTHRVFLLFSSFILSIRQYNTIQ